MHGTMSDEGLIVPGESVVFLAVWIGRLGQIDARWAAARRRGGDDTPYQTAYEAQQRMIDAYVGAYWEGKRHGTHGAGAAD